MSMLPVTPDYDFQEYFDFLDLDFSQCWITATTDQADVGMVEEQPTKKRNKRKWSGEEEVGLAKKGKEDLSKI